MENELLSTLQAIRGYIFVLMIFATILIILKVVETILRIKTEYQKVDQKNFCIKMDKYFDAGDYEEIIDRCKYRLESYPNNIDANWYLAKAYYFKEENDLSKKYFQYTLHCAPHWEDSVEPYLRKLESR